MKSINLIFFLFLSVIVNAQQIKEYRDSGDIRTIETKCVQGNFNGKGELIRRKSHGYELTPDEEITRFDTSGNVEFQEVLYAIYDDMGQIWHSTRFTQYVYSTYPFGDSTVQEVEQFPSGDIEITYEISNYDTISQQTYSYKQNGELDYHFIGSNNIDSGFVEMLIYDGNNELMVKNYFYVDSLGRTIKTIEYDLMSDFPDTPEITCYEYHDSVEHSYELSGTYQFNHVYKTYNQFGLLNLYQTTYSEDLEYEPLYFTFEYEYDEYNNWIVKRVYNKGQKLIAVETRKIVYR